MSQLQPAMDVLDQIAAKSGVIGEQWKKVSAAMNAGNATSVQSTVKLSDAVNQVEQSQKDVAQQAKVTGAAVDAQNKSNTDGANKLAKSIDQLAVASKSMDKVVIGAAYKQYLTEIQNTLHLTNNEVIAYIQNAKKAAQEGIFNAADDQQMKEISLSIEVMNDQLKQLGVSEDGAGQKTQTLRQRIKEAKDELVAMADAGLKGTPAFEELKARAGAMENQFKDLNETISNVGSDTKNLDGLISLASGVAGGYAVAQGAAALFGSENADVAQSLLKVNAAMSILQGLQQVGLVLQEKSSANILLDTVFRTKNTEAIVANSAASEADVAAKTLEAAGTDAATVAQKGLNVAMLASPVGILILSVGTIVGLYQIFADNAKKAAEAQTQYNNALQDATKINDDFVSSVGQAGSELSLQLQLQGKSQEQIRKQQAQTLKDQITQQQNFVQANAAQYERAAEVLRAVSEGRIKLNADEIDGLEKTRDQYDAIQKKLFELQAALRQLDLNNALADNKQSLADVTAYANAKVAATVAGTDAERKAQIQAINDIAAAREKDVDFLSKTDAEKAAIRANDEKQIQSLQLQNYQHYLTSRTAAVDAQLAIAKAHQATSDADQIASINKITDLQIASIKRTAEEQIKGNPTLNADQIKKINDEANLAIVEAEKKKQQDILEIQKTELTNQLAAAQKGSYDEYVYKLALIENSRLAEVAAAGKNVDLLKSINDKYLKQKLDADNAFNQQELNNEISRDNASLDRFGITEQDKLELTIKRLNDQQALEISQAEGNAAKIAEIDAKYDKQIRDARLSSINTVLAANLKSMDVMFDASTQLNNHILNDNKTSAEQKLQANSVLNKMEQDKLDVQLNALKKSKADGLITEEQYTEAYQDILNKRNVLLQTKTDKDTEIIRAGIQKQIELVKASFDIMQNGIDTMDTGALKTGLTQVFDLWGKIKDIQNSDASDQDKKNAEITAGVMATQATINQVFADASAERQQQLSDNIQALENEKNVELNNANLTAKQKQEIDAQYAAKEKQVRLKAFNDEKQAKKEQAIANGALAITNILATVPKFDFGVSTAIMIAAAIAATALQVNAINQTKPPAFKRGIVDLDPKEWFKSEPVEFLKPYTGQINIQGPGTTTSDSIHAKISKGESVIAANPTAKWKEALKAINTDTFENYLTQKLSAFVYPYIPEHVQPRNNNPREIDYDRLATAIANKMKDAIPAPKSTHVNIDKNGIHTIVEEGRSRIEYKNKRHSIN